jgi:radical SAM protein with 4Fe4S-binding SPASM domain
MMMYLNSLIDSLKVFSFSKILVHPKYFFNRLLLNTSFALNLKKSLGKPAYIVIELTNHCNLKCVMCPQPRQKREAGFMSFELFKSIIDQVESYAEVIDLDLFGEILLHKDFDKFIAYGKSKGLKMMVSTNIMLLNEKNSRRLIESGLDFITLSLDGAKKETFESVRVGGNFERCVENIETFLGINKGRVFSTIQIINMKQTHGEIIDFLEKFKNHDTNVLRVIPYTSHDPTKRDLNCDFNYKSTGNHCAFLWRTSVITWNGKVVPCCQDWDDNIVLGDLKDNSILEVWNGERMQTMRDAHIKGDRVNYEICQGCDAFNPSKLTMLGSSILDDYNANKILPVLQKNYIESNIRKKN